VRVECACDPGLYFEVESCESGSFPHPDLGESPPPSCGIVDGCQGTFTRVASGDAASVDVISTCFGETSGSCDPSDLCECGCSAGVCLPCSCDPPDSCE
jgi:hypothetical protein